MEMGAMAGAPLRSCFFGFFFFGPEILLMIR